MPKQPNLKFALRSCLAPATQCPRVAWPWVKAEAHLYRAAEAAGCLANECGDKDSEDELDYQAGGVHAHNTGAQQDEFELIGHSNNAQQVGRHCQQQRQRWIPPGRCCECHSHTCASDARVRGGLKKIIASVQASLTTAAADRSARSTPLQTAHARDP